MTMYVSFDKYSTELVYVGEGQHLRAHAKFVTSIQCDGHELLRASAILNRPVPSQRVYTFFGDSAKEVVANWY